MSDEQVAQFVGVTGASQAQAQFWLESSSGDVELAVASFFEQQAAGDDADMSDQVDDNNDTTVRSAQGMPGAFTLGGSGIASGTVETSASTTSGQSTTTGPTRGAYTLSGEPAPPLPASWQTASGQGQPGSRSHTPSQISRSTGGARIASLRDYNAPSAGPSTGGSRLGRISHDDDNGGNNIGDEDEDGDEKDPLEYFAGGEKSGLSLQNPNARPPASGASDVVRGILRQAVEGTNRMAALRNTTSMAGVQPLLNVFRGSGHTLGSEDEPSKVVPDPEARNKAQQDSDEDNEEPAVRNLTFWEDGFSIEDGDLMRYDDPANAGILAAINAGRAPLSLLNVRHDQPVELRIAKRLNEKWTRQAPVPKKAFEGQGNRLGSTTPTIVASSGSGGSSVQQREQSAISSSESSAVKPFEVDQSLPTTQLQIRLRDGSRMVARFNHTHTVGDIRRYINASGPGQSASDYVLQTTFPSRELTDEGQTLSDAGLLGSVVVQKGV
ncbi:protein phosphatase regulator [Microbotryomycetes sp. JL201]|nr:protein phosphatase regulator [Microbotryomycetes sp. JL201]